MEKFTYIPLIKFIFQNMGSGMAPWPHWPYLPAFVYNVNSEFFSFSCTIYGIDKSVNHVLSLTKDLHCTSANVFNLTFQTNTIIRVLYSLHNIGA